MRDAELLVRHGPSTRDKKRNTRITYRTKTRTQLTGKWRAASEDLLQYVCECVTRNLLAAASDRHGINRKSNENNHSTNCCTVGVANLTIIDAFRRQKSSPQKRRGHRGVRVCNRTYVSFSRFKLRC